MRKLFSWLYFVFFLAAVQALHAEKPVPLHQQEHLDVLSVYTRNAEDYVSKNLNRFGLNQMLNYDAALDTMYQSELADTIEAFNTNYLRSHQSRTSTITSLNDRIGDLSEKKESAISGLNGLLRKAGIAFLLWLCIVLVILQIRNRTLKRAQARLDASKDQLAQSDRLMAAGKRLLDLSHAEEFNDRERYEKSQQLQKVFSEHPLTEQNGFTKEAAEQLKAAVSEVVRTAASSYHITRSLASQNQDPGSEKVNTSLNLLCEQCFELVFNGMRTGDPEMKIVISKDLEKNIPQIKLIPEAVAQLLINVLINAFQSVKEKASQNIKEYVPKVTISTRVLPRFLQVRIFDNGDGMPDEVIRQLGEPYFTLKTNSHAAGLGMHFARKIIEELHQGELKIESEPGNKTDVYLKFFTD